MLIVDDLPYDEPEEESAEEVINTIKEASKKQEEVHNTPFQAGSPFGGKKANVPDDHGLVEIVAEPTETSAAKMTNAQTKSIHEAPAESSKSRALSMFVTIIAITGLGFAIWFHFSDQGKELIRQFNKGYGTEPKEEEIKLRTQGDRKYK